MISLSQQQFNIPEICGSLQSSSMSEVNTHGEASCFALGLVNVIDTGLNCSNFPLNINFVPPCT